MKPKEFIRHCLGLNQEAPLFAKPPLKDDLTVIEGIGPNIQRLFFQNNINSWESLSKCSVQKCQSILDAAGEAYKMHSPKGWPDQARMAHRGQWERLRKWKKQTLS